MEAQRARQAMLARTSSSTTNPGGRPASSGCSAKSRWQNPWIVPIAASSICASATEAGDAVAVLAGRGRQRAPDPRPELRRGRLGEGDCGDLAQFRTPAPDELDDALDHCRRLARAGAGLHEERRIEVFRDRTARLFVRQGPRSGGRRRLEL